MASKFKLFLATSLLIAIAGSISYGFKRFFSGDYLVQYQAPCNPTEESCFVSDCESGEENCEVGSFKYITKYRSDLSRECGNTIVDCEFASKCITSDRWCELEYCKSEDMVDGLYCSM